MAAAAEQPHGLARASSIGEMGELDRRDTSARNNTREMRRGGVAAVVGTLTAEFDFEGEEEKDLCFKAGQKIAVLKVREKDWWIGATEDGRRGLFPINFMRRDDTLIKLTQARLLRNKSWDGGR